MEDQGLHLDIPPSSINPIQLRQTCRGQLSSDDILLVHNHEWQLSLLPTSGDELPTTLSEEFKPSESSPTVVARRIRVIIMAWQMGTKLFLQVKEDRESDRSVSMSSITYNSEYELGDEGSAILIHEEEVNIYPLV